MCVCICVSVLLVWRSVHQVLSSFTHKNKWMITDSPILKNKQINQNKTKGNQSMWYYNVLNGLCNYDLSTGYDAAIGKKAEKDSGIRAKYHSTLLSNDPGLDIHNSTTTDCWLHCFSCLLFLFHLWWTELWADDVDFCLHCRINRWTCLPKLTITGTFGTWCTAASTYFNTVRHQDTSCRMHNCKSTMA